MRQKTMIAISDDFLYLVENHKERGKDLQIVYRQEE